MNQTLKTNQLAGLRALYKNSPAAKAMFDAFATRQRDRRVTLASQAAYLADASYEDTLALLKKLDDLGVGEYKVGRRGGKTRIEWVYSIRGIGLAANGSTSQVKEIDEAEVETIEEELAQAEEGTNDGMLEHTFQLRQDMAVSFKLPSDFSAKDAERLSGFIRQVPFDG